MMNMKRFLSLLLSLAMLLSLLPLSVFAEQTGTELPLDSTPGVVDIDEEPIILPDVEIEDSIKISAQPADRTADAGEQVTFAVAAQGTFGDLSYQWYYRKSASGDWTEIIGATKNTYGFAAAADMNGYQFRCMVSEDAYSYTYTQPATLTVVVPVNHYLNVTAQPRDAEAKENGSASFTVAAESDGDISYRWQYRTAGSEQWADVEGGTSATLNVTAAASLNGCSYRCCLSDSNGKSTISSDASLTVHILTITRIPADTWVKEGGDAVFSVAAESDGSLSYRWQERDKASGEWKDIEGGTAASLTVTGSAEKDGTLYRCIVSDSYRNEKIPVAVELIVHILTITTEPSDAAKEEGETASFTVAASSDGSVSYRWQRKAPGTETWTDVEDGRSATLSVETEAAKNGSLYRCVVSDSYGNEKTSTPALLTVHYLKFTEKPADVDAAPGGSAVFTAAAESDSKVSYLWQSRAGDSGSWTNVEGGTSATLTVSASADKDGRSYRCTVSDENGHSDDATATLRVHSLAIVTQPAPVSVDRDGTAAFTVAAEGDGSLSYLWQGRKAPGEWIDLEGETAATLTFSAEAELDGTEYRCVVKDAYGNSETSDAAALTVIVHTLTAVTQPADASVSEGGEAKFTFLVDGDGTLTYVWKYRFAASDAWILLERETSATCSVSATLPYSGSEYRCTVTDGYGNETTSASAKLTVIPAVHELNFTEQPADQTVDEGGHFHFSVAAASDGELSYQWQYSENESDWNDISGATFSSFGQDAKADMNGYYFRCVASDSYGITKASNPAVLHVTPKAAHVLTFTAEPQNRIVNAGDSATFSVTVESDGTVSYRWQYREASTGSWVDLEDETSSTLTLTGSAENNGFQYRCVASDDYNNEIPSGTATLTVREPEQHYLTITKQPASLTVNAGEGAEFTVAAESDGSMTYQWQSAASVSGDWAAMDGQTSANLTVTALAERSGIRYRCVVTDSNGLSAVSDVVTLTVHYLKIVEGPEDLTVSAGETAVFTVTAKADSEMSYRWQYRTGSLGSWTDAGTFSSCSFTAEVGMSGRSYRCLISDEFGGTAETETVTLTVHYLILGTQPEDAEALAGESAEFTLAAASDGTLAYRWQERAGEGESWKDVEGGDSETLSLTAAADMDGRSYRCVVTDGNGHTAYSRTATLKVTLYPLDVTAQPADATADAGAEAKFTVAAEGHGTLTYRWQTRDEASGEWKDLSGKTAATLTLTAAAELDGTAYRCVVADAYGSEVTSSAATLTVVVHTLEITAQPEGASADEDAEAKFTVAAKGDGTLSYQWQSRDKASGEWKDLSGKTAATLTLTAAAELDGTAYRCIVADAYGNSETSREAVLTVIPKPVQSYAWGDVNHSGTVDSDDAMLILRYDVKKIGADKLDLSLADVSGDGRVDSDDAMLVLRFDVKRISVFPVEIKE